MTTLPTYSVRCVGCKALEAVISLAKGSLFRPTRLLQSVTNTLIGGQRVKVSNYTITSAAALALGKCFSRWKRVVCHAIAIKIRGGGFMLKDLSHSVFSL